MEVPSDSSVEIERKVIAEGGEVSAPQLKTTLTTTTQVKRKVKESQWKVRVEHSLVTFAANDDDTSKDVVIIAQRDVSTTVVTGGGRHQASETAPVPPPYGPSSD